jgi:putative acetyltransferase
MASRKKRKVRVRVRGYESSDALAVAEILSGQNMLAGTPDVPHRSNEELMTRLEKREHGTRTLVAELDGEVMAVGGLRLVRSLRARHVANLWISVADDVEGRGVAGHLLDALLDLGQRWMGILRFQLEVFVDDEAAIKRYREHGFEIEGVIRGSALRAGKLVDSFLLGRMAEQLPWPQITARDVAQRLPALLPPGRDPSKN